MTPKFFETVSELRNWFESVVETESCKEIWIGFYKKGVGKVNVTYAEAVDEALCFGWIDGIRKKVDEMSYMNRFTPRRPKSNWSKLNISHVGRLTLKGKMMPSGLKQVALAKANGKWL
jgi:uncharacterized protein YdeI (YjbR/CyaY-like superfamily)